MSTILNDDDDFIVIDGKRVLKDGRTLRVRLNMMDSAVADDTPLRRPGARYSADAAAAERRQTAFDAYMSDIGGAWRNPDPPSPTTADAKPPTTDARTAALAARDVDLANAWRGGAQ